MAKQTAIAAFSDEQDLKKVLATQYMKQIENLFGDKEKALEFLTNVVATVQRNPKLLDCKPETLLNSLMLMASLKLMPSGVSGEAFVLPYKDEAQFQLGYQGLITLLYRAGAKSVMAELVRRNDKFTIKNGHIEHEVDPRKNSKERGEVDGAYAIITLAQGEPVEQFMHVDDIYAHGKKFSKSFGSSFSPWNAESDPQGWMLRKTVLKQAAKLAPKNSVLITAVAEDNKDSIISDRQEASKAVMESKDWSEQEELLLSMQNLTALIKYYADLPAEAKIALKGIYEGQKAILEQEAKDSIQV